MPLVEIFTREQPRCAYCTLCKEMLAKEGVSYTEIDIVNQHNRKELKTRAPEARTIPQIFVDGHHVGGYEELKKEIEDGLFKNRFAGAAQ